MDKKEKKSLPEPRTYTVEQIGGHAQHWPHNRISARQAGGVQDRPHRQCDPRFQEIF